MRNFKKIAIALLTALMVAGCSAKKEVKIDVQETLDGIVATYFEGYNGANYDAEYIEANFGLTADQYETFAGTYPMISMAAIDLGIIEAKDGKVEEVVAGFESYKEFKKGNAWYPMEQMNAESAVIYQNGNYVFFIMAENAEEIKTYVEGLFEAK